MALTKRTPVWKGKPRALESDKVKAELLELETDALQNSLQRLIQQQVLGLVGMAGMGGSTPLTPEQAREREVRLDRFRMDREKRVEDLRESYFNKRLDLAKLKRKIARESKELGEAVAATPSLTEMSARLRALETKVDRILEAVSKNSR